MPKKRRNSAALLPMGISLVRCRTAYVESQLNASRGTDPYGSSCLTGPRPSSSIPLWRCTHTAPEVRMNSDPSILLRGRPTWHSTECMNLMSKTGAGLGGVGGAVATSRRRGARRGVGSWAVSTTSARCYFHGPATRSPVLVIRSSSRPERHPRPESTRRPRQPRLFLRLDHRHMAL